jgi:predicted transglutaminase-like cysteine proteinase
MFRRFRLRGAAALLILLSPVLAERTPAFAQDRQSQDRQSAVAIDQAISAAAAATPPVAGAAPDQSPAPAEPFGGAMLPVTAGQILDKWNGVVADIRAESAILTQCRDDAAACPAAAQKFLAVIAEGRSREGRARAGVINRAINLAIEPTSDLAQWGVPDRWSAPLQTLASGRGDCEDYAIAKYVALREAGVAESDLRFVIVRDLSLGADHAVTVTRLGDKWIVLDNRRFMLLEDVDMQRVVPLFVLDRDGVKRFAPPAVATAATATPGALGF